MTNPSAPHLSPGTAAPHVGTRGLVPEVMDAHFSTLHPLWVEQHLRLLCELRRLFGADLDKPIILAVIGQRHFATTTGHPYDYQTALHGDVPIDMSRLTNMESIATATGVPRETVRRKVNELVEAGWVERGPHGALVVTQVATRELGFTTGCANKLLDVMFEALANAIVADGHLRIEAPDRAGDG